MVSKQISMGALSIGITTPPGHCRQIWVVKELRSWNLMAYFAVVVISTTMPIGLTEAIPATSTTTPADLSMSPSAWMLIIFSALGIIGICMMLPQRKATIQGVADQNPPQSSSSTQLFEEQPSSRSQEPSSRSQEYPPVRRKEKMCLFCQKRSH